eukprot:scaffold463184_cov18-Prasinocladus_malaysianus.AAC.1
MKLGRKPVPPAVLEGILSKRDLADVFMGQLNKSAAATQTKVNTGIAFNTISFVLRLGSMHEKATIHSNGLSLILETYGNNARNK